MSVVACHFDKCGLYFINKYELIFHIEEDHIEIIKKKRTYELEQLTKNNNRINEDESIEVQHQNAIQQQDQLNAQYNQPIPMSLLCKLNPFFKNHNVHPITPKPLVLNFCHYRKRIASPIEENLSLSKIANVSSINYHINDSCENTSLFYSSNNNLKRSTNKRISSEIKNITDSVSNVSDYKEETINKSTVQQSLTSPVTNLISTVITPTTNDERKFRCDIDGCKKAYKNQQGLRAHIRNAHNTLSSNVSAIQRLSPSEEGILNRQLLGSSQITSLFSVNNPISKFPLNIISTTNSINDSNNLIYLQQSTAQDRLSNSANTSESNTSMNTPFLSNINNNCSDTLQLDSASVLSKPSTFFEELKNTSNLASETAIVRSSNEQNNAETGNSLNFVIVSTGSLPNSLNNITNNGSTSIKQIVQPSITTSTTYNYGPPSLIMHSQQRLVSQKNFTGKYQCQYCPKTYKTLMNLNKHVQDSHPKQILPDVSVSPVNQQQLQPSMSSLVRSQSPRTIIGSSLSMVSKQIIVSSAQSTLSNSNRNSGTSLILPQQSSQPTQSQITYSNTLIPTSQQTVTLVTADPPQVSTQHSLSTIYNAQKQTSQSSQQYYVASSPVQIQAHSSQQSQQQIQGQKPLQCQNHQQLEHQYIPSQSSPTNSQVIQPQTTNIYVSQQQQQPIMQLQHYTVSHAPQSQQQNVSNSQQIKWMSWSDANGPKQRVDNHLNSNVSQSLQNSAVVVGRTLNNSLRNQSLNRVHSQHLQTTQPSIQVSSQGIRQQQYYQQHRFGSHPTQVLNNILGNNGNSSVASVSPINAASSSVVVTTSNTTTTTIRVSSLNQFHHQQQPQQYVQIQQQNNSFTSSPQQYVQTVVSSQPQYQQQISNSPTFVVRTSQIHHNQNQSTRYVTQTQYTSSNVTNNSSENISTLSQMVSSTTTSSTNRFLTAVSSPSATISLSLSNSGTVYYRSNPSTSAVSQQVVLRNASGSQSQLPQNTSVRMFAVGNNSHGYVSQSQYYYQQTSNSQAYPPVSQQRMNRGSGRYGNGVLQSTQHQQINIGNVSTENLIIPTNSSNYFSQPQNGLALIHSSSAPTAVALANADPSTPIRAIVSRALVEQANRHNYLTKNDSGKGVTIANNRSSFYHSLTSVECKSNAIIGTGESGVSDAPKLIPQTTFSQTLTMQQDSSNSSVSTLSSSNEKLIIPQQQQLQNLQKISISENTSLNTA